VAGAYVRHLRGLTGGYPSSHSDVHLWYHGTIDWQTPSNDTEATITSNERSSWWTASENQGVTAGYHYSLIGGGDRTSTNQPAGPGSAAIRDGYNQAWDLGAGTSNNREPLPAHVDPWPSLIKINRTTTHEVIQGESIPVRFYYQWAEPGSNSATVSISLDLDLNPFNNNQALLNEFTAPATGASSLHSLETNLIVHAAPGSYSVLAAITGGGRTRYLYAPERVDVLGVLAPPRLEIARAGSNQLRITVHGAPEQSITLQVTTDLRTWMPWMTHTLTEPAWVLTNSLSGGASHIFYRAILNP
jgi:hypothetical protein